MPSGRIWRYLRIGGMGAGYAVATLLNALNGLIAVPALIAISGADAWAGIALAQSIGALAFVAVGFGWGLVGPATVAALKPEHQSEYYLRATRSRLLLFLACGPAYVGAVALLNVPGTSFAANVIAGGSVLIMGLGGSWYFVGIGAPRQLVAVDVLPRIAATIGAVLVLLASESLLLFASLQAAGPALSAILAWKHARNRVDSPRFSLRADIANVRTVAPAAVTAGTAALFVNVPLILVSSLAPADLTSYALADKIQKALTAALRPVVQVLQSMVPRGAEEATLSRRVRRVAIGSIPCFITLAIVLSFAFPLLSTLFAGEAISIPVDMTIAFSTITAAILASGMVGLVGLVTLRLQKQLAISTVIGAVVGLGSAIVLVGRFGGSGVAWGVATAEISVYLYQLAVVATVTGRRSNEKGD